jgi:hypothetical protein
MQDIPYFSRLAEWVPERLQFANLFLGEPLGS